MKHICKCRDKQQAGHYVSRGLNELGEPVYDRIVTDHCVNATARNVGRPEFYENARGETVMSFRLFRQANFEALCAHLCGGRLTRSAS